MALDRHPGAAGRDAHLLVVIALRPAGGEGVPQPEAVLDGDVVGQVGERRGAAVGGHDQVGVVAIGPDDPVGGDDLAPLDGVGQVQQAADEHLVLRLDLRAQVGGIGRALLQDEPALGPGGDDDGVLAHLRLHQAQHLGAEVVQAV